MVDVRTLRTPSRELQYDVELRRDVMVPMRDGVKLATDIYLPRASDGSVLAGLPTLLSRTPYNKEGSGSVEGGAGTGIQATARYFASHGYAVVVQDTRGRHKSKGIWHMLTDDGRDGVDTCAWVATQPWSNASIGMFGTSYGGGTQHAPALERVPELKTVIPVDAMSNFGYQSMRNGGAFELRWWNWIFTRSADGGRQRRDPATRAMLEEMSANRRYYLMHLPLRRSTTPLKHAEEYEDWLVSAMENKWDDLWVQNNVRDQAHQYKDMPVYLVGGWYDSWAGNTAANYQALSKAIKGPVYLIMGPWIHGQQGRYAHGQVSFGAEAAILDPLAWRLEWFDKWLKGINNSVGRSAPFATQVRIFVMGTGDGRKTEDGYLNHGGFWREEREWPLARTRHSNYYLHPGGRLSTEPPDLTSSFTSFDFDPRDPVPTIGGNISSANGIMLQGAWDQRGGEHIWNWQIPIPLSARRDVLVFQTDPLPQDIEVTGEIEVKLWAASSAVDTDFTAKLIDVYPASPDYPGGFDLNLEDGIVRARFRESLRDERLMEPNTPYEFTIKLYPTSNIFKKGHRIRLDISSSNFPRFDVNPNTGEPLNQYRRICIATSTVFHDRDRASHVVLPVIPAS